MKLIIVLAPIVKSFPLLSASAILTKSVGTSKELRSFVVKHLLIHRAITSSFHSSTTATIIKRSMSIDSNVQAALYPNDLLWDPSWVMNTGEETIKRRSVNSTTSNTDTSNNNDSENNTLQFYSSWFCPFAQRTWIALEESGVNYQWIEINPYHVDPTKPGGYTKKSLSIEEKRIKYPDFIKASPRGLVPALCHTVNNENGNGTTKRYIWESLPASEYVDTVFGTGTLFPKDPFERCLVQIWCDHCTNRIQQQYYKALMAQDMTKKKAYIQQFHIECRALAQAMYTCGPYFLGNRFSMVDVVFAPFWQRILWIGQHYITNEILFPFDDNDNDFQRLNQWWDAVRVRPSIAATFVCKERLISSYSDYSLNVATSDFAKSINS